MASTTIGASLRVGRPKPNAILLIDDNRDTTFLLGRFLELEGFHVTTALHKEEALQLLAEQKPDLIITEVMLPEREGMQKQPNGIDMIRITKQNERLASIPIIAVGAYGQRLLDEAMTAGAIAVFTKPIELGLLITKINEILSASETNLDESDNKPDRDLIIPVRNSIILINERLLDVFQKDPQFLRKISPRSFENVVAELFEEEGYEVALTPKRADGGKDIYVYKKDPLTEVMFLVECKRYIPPNKVSVEIVRQLYGVVQSERASGGVLVTTSYFTKPAKDFAEGLPYQLFLRDFDYLTQWLKKTK